MISESIIVTKKEKKEYPPIPEDVYQVELVDINLKEVDSKYDKGAKDKVFDFQFTILEGKDADGSDLRGRNIWRNFIPTYLYEGKNGKNLLYQILEATLSRTLTIEEEAWMDQSFLNGLVGKQLRILITNTSKDGKTYSNIKSFLPKKADLKSLTAEELEVVRVKKDPNAEIKVSDEEIPVV